MRYFLLLLLLASCGGGGGSVPVTPSTPRTDRAYFGYYGGVQSENPEATIIFASTWHGQDAQLRQVIEASQAGLPVMLDIAAQMSLPLDPIADEDRLVARLQAIRGAAALSSIAALYFDELDHMGRYNDAAALEMANVLRRASARAGITPKLATSYSVSGTFPGAAGWDWIGTSNPDDRLKSVIRPHQRILLVARGADPWRDDPALFLNSVQTDPQVICLLVFAWTGGNESGDANNWGAGVRSNGMATIYRQVGLKIKG